MKPVLKRRINVSEETTWETLTSCRWILAYMACFGSLLMIAIRISMGIAIICITKPDNQTFINNGCDTEHSTCKCSNSSILTSEGVNWSKPVQGWILSSYFYGYILTQIPSGYLAGRFGGKRVMLVGMLFDGISTVILPFAIRIYPDDPNIGGITTIVCRIVTGMASGVIFPALQNLCGKWAPPYERSKLNVLSMSGLMLGNVVMLATGGFLCEWKEFDGGWPSIFYIYGSLRLLFCLAWTFIIFDSPLEHPRITSKEKNFIVTSLREFEITKNTFVPWLKIMRSPSVWAIIVAHISVNVGDYTLSTKLPGYMKEVLGLEIMSNGLYSALPYIASFFVANTVSVLIDTLRKKRILETRTARKLVTTIALVVPGGLLVVIGQIPGNNEHLAILLLTLAIGLTGFDNCGYIVNIQDIAARYAGEIFSISNTFSTIPGMVTPLLVNFMTTQGTQEEWQTVFYVWAGIYCFGAVFYLIFAKGETQDWAKDRNEEKNAYDNPETLEESI